MGFVSYDVSSVKTLKFSFTLPDLFKIRTKKSSYLLRSIKGQFLSSRWGGNGGGMKLQARSGRMRGVLEAKATPRACLK